MTIVVAQNMSVGSSNCLSQPIVVTPGDLVLIGVTLINGSGVTVVLQQSDDGHNWLSGANIDVTTPGYSSFGPNTVSATHLRLLFGADFPPGPNLISANMQIILNRPACANPLPPT